MLLSSTSTIRGPWAGLAAAVAVSVLASAVHASSNYVGAQRCQSCHPFEYSVWSRGPHASAHKSLSADELKDSKCNQCHTLLPEDLSPRYLGVQCEQCHGGGKYYAPDYVMKDRELARALGLADVKPEICQQCHTVSAPSIEPFHFDVFWARIDHSRARRLEWERKRAELTAGGSQRD